MRWLAALIIAGLPAALVPQAQAASTLPDGTLLFLENCNSVVQWTTHGKIAHVALLFHEGTSDWVYEATPAKVRRVALDEYYAELSRLNRHRDHEGQIRLVALCPQPEYSSDEVAKMRTFLDAQLGRRYSVKNYVRGKPYDGIHCAELASTTLNQSGRYKFEDCHKINPRALFATASMTHASPQILPIPQPVETESWCARTQRRWLAWLAWCRWSSREAWLFFW